MNDRSYSAGFTLELRVFGHVYELGALLLNSTWILKLVTVCIDVFI